MHLPIRTFGKPGLADQSRTMLGETERRRATSAVLTSVGWFGSGEGAPRRTAS